MHHGDAPVFHRISHADPPDVPPDGSIGHKRTAFAVAPQYADCSSRAEEMLFPSVIQGGSGVTCGATRGEPNGD